ncbi:uncharacterized protein H6S33_003361 [Morchella sextelata]|uniref:uncharacterized protein n=1 Tax=Morchella sextelata TaxID=1174677 RepID=UPI001D03BABF|nr:uncharacterized protein H6S33_003361 [Morchella sextelata]KAH0606527.1 hypothetical protein H6S33_003361 [Morchella sextelata]
MKTDTPTKPKQIEIKQEPLSDPPTPPAKLSDSDIEDMFKKQMLRKTLGHITDDESEEEEEEDASIVGVGFSRSTPERTPQDDVDTDTDQPRYNPVRERKTPARYGYNIQNDVTLTEPTNYHHAINSPDSEK